MAVTAEPRPLRDSNFSFQLQTFAVEIFGRHILLPKKTLTSFDNNMESENYQHSSIV